MPMFKKNESPYRLIVVVEFIIYAAIALSLAFYITA
jgi:hypothetical protein